MSLLDPAPSLPRPFTQFRNFIPRVMMVIIPLRRDKTNVITFPTAVSVNNIARLRGFDAGGN